MNILDDFEKRLAGYSASLRGLEADLAATAAGLADPVKRAALEQLILSIRGKLAGIETAGRLEVEGAPARIDAGLRALEELRARKEALAERMKQLRAQAGKTHA